MNPTPSHPEHMLLQRPINGKTLEAVREAVGALGSARHPLVIRTWPEMEKLFRGVAGFRAAEHYGDEETDDMVKGEIGRVGGFRIVIRWNGQPARSPAGQIRSDVTGGIGALCVDIEEHG